MGLPYRDSLPPRNPHQAELGKTRLMSGLIASPLGPDANDNSTCRPRGGDDPRSGRPKGFRAACRRMLESINDLHITFLFA